MDFDEKNLGAAFADFTKPVEQVADPVVEEIVTDPLTEEVVEEVVTNKVIPTETGTEDEEDYIKSFAESIGYTGEIEGDDFETITKIAQNQINSYKEKAEFYEANETIKGLAEHLQAGGTIEEYFATPQETNYFQEIAFEADDVEGREQLLQHFFINVKGMEAEDAEALINGYKEKGTFNTQADKALLLLKGDEEKQNTSVREAREQELATRKETTQKLITELTQSFDEGFNGVTVDKTVLNKAKELSLPNKQGQFGIIEVANKLTSKQQGMLNIFVTALTENKAFQYNPTANISTPAKSKLISQILNKNKSATSGGVAKSLEEVNKIFSNRQLVN